MHLLRGKLQARLVLLHPELWISAPIEHISSRSHQQAQPRFRLQASGPTGHTDFAVQWGLPSIGHRDYFRPFLSSCAVQNSHGWVRVILGAENRIELAGSSRTSPEHVDGTGRDAGCHWLAARGFTA